jgi:hypothetical protein
MWKTVAEFCASGALKLVDNAVATALVAVASLSWLRLLAFGGWARCAAEKADGWDVAAAAGAIVSVGFALLALCVVLGSLWDDMSSRLTRFRDGLRRERLAVVENRQREALAETILKAARRRIYGRIPEQRLRDLLRQTGYVKARLDFSVDAGVPDEKLVAEYAARIADVSDGYLYSVLFCPAASPLLPLLPEALDDEELRDKQAREAKTKAKAESKAKAKAKSKAKSKAKAKPSGGRRD